MDAIALERPAAGPDPLNQNAGAPNTGGCLCGAVRFEVGGPFPAVGHCHCSICRRMHGAAFATWAIVDPGKFRWISGETRLGHFASSPGRTRVFCTKCGSPLAATHDGKVNEIVLAALEGDPGVRPQAHAFVGSKAPWYEIGEALPQFEAWPPELQPED